MDIEEVYFMMRSPSLFGHSKTWLFIGGIFFIILGIAAIGAQFTATLITVMFIGSIIMLGGVLSIIDAFVNWRHRWGDLALHLALGFLYLIIGYLVINSPLLATVSITFLLGVFYLIVGVFRLIFSAISRLPSWGWVFFSGLVSALLGFLILISWPESSLFIIGLFVGIDLLFWGWGYIMAAIALHNRRLTRRLDS